MKSFDVPMGTIVAFVLSASNIPNGWLPCDGSAIPAQYQELISALGSNNTPNLTGRTLIGTGVPDDSAQSDGSIPNFTPGLNWSVGYTGGEFAHQLVTAEMPSHNHSLVYEFDLASGCHSDTGSSPCLSSTVNYTNNTGGDAVHNTMQPYYAVNYIIFAG